VSVEVLITETSFESRLAVNTCALSASDAIETGLVPTGIVLLTSKLRLLTTLTEFDPVLAT
jgi:hypothetical protein